jgi:hypothetical protein
MTLMTLMTLITLMTSMTLMMSISLRLYYQHKGSTLAFADDAIDTRLLDTDGDVLQAMA